MEWNEGLEGPGLVFAASEAPRTRCLAGPGTGKTFSLMRRVQRLIEVVGVAPERILVVTLTRTAADDLRRSLAELRVAGAERVVTSTLHSLCFSILLHDDVLTITGRTPRLLAGFERDILLKDLPDDLGTFTHKKQLLKEFQAAWSALDGTPLGTAPGSLPAEFQGALVQSFRWHKCMLVGELVPIARTYLEENPYSSALERFDHVLVDEYQDLNRADHGVLELLGQAALRRGGQVAIIGDDDQCIYVLLRNAHPRGIVDYEADLDVPLLECRRCPTRITAMAESLIAHNPGRAKPALLPRLTNPPGSIHNVIFRTMEDETEGLAQFIHERINRDGIEPGEVLVLANWRVLGYRIRDRLIELGDEAHSYFREEPLDTLDARRALSLLTLVARPDDRVALRALLALSGATEERAAYRRVLSRAADTGVTALEVLRQLFTGEAHIPFTDRCVAAYAEVSGQVDGLRTLSGDVRELVDRACPAGCAPTTRLREAMEHVLLDPEACSDICSFESALRTQIGVPEVPLSASFVRVMSLHKSKGLTVKMVVIAGLVEGLVPRHPKEELAGAAANEHEREQRRMLFVGITRPTEELVLSRFQEIDSHSAHVSRAETGRWVGRGIRSTVSSTLLREFGPELPAVVRQEDWRY